MNENGPTLSIVLPVYNEVENIPLLAEEIRQALDPHGFRYRARRRRPDDTRLKQVSANRQVGLSRLGV